MKQFFIDLCSQRKYWVTLVLFGIALEAIALYYQYVLDEWPCVLCIHIRIWIAVFILIGLAAIFIIHSSWARRLAHGLTVVAMIGLLERSWNVLAVERGWIFGDCEMSLGMPSWFAIDQWLPSIFEVQTSCGYTPLVLFNITMAEVLLVFSITLLIMSTGVFIASWFD